MMTGILLLTIGDMIHTIATCMDMVGDIPVSMVAIMASVGAGVAMADGVMVGVAMAGDVAAGQEDMAGAMDTEVMATVDVGMDMALDMVRGQDLPDQKG